jgi:hypothetical protein
MPTYKPVGVDENGNFPTRVQTALAKLFGSKVKRGTPKTAGGVLQWGVPGTSFHQISTSALTAGEIRYVPFEIKNATTITSLALEVTTGPTAAGNVAIGIYAADGFHQPTGAPVYASAAIPVASGFTGIKSVTGLTTVLAPGLYLLAMNVDQAMTIRIYTGPTTTILNGLGANALATRYIATLAFAVMPTQPIPWTSVVGGVVGTSYFLVAQWTE